MRVYDSLACTITITSTPGMCPHLMVTDESKQIREENGNLSNVIGLNVVYDKTFDIIAPQRIWCFQCKFNSEYEYWIESMKWIEDCQFLHDGDKPNDWDHLNFSADESVHKLIPKMGPPETQKDWQQSPSKAHRTNVHHDGHLPFTSESEQELQGMSSTNSVLTRFMC